MDFHPLWVKKSVLTRLPLTAKRANVEFFTFRLIPLPQRDTVVKIRRTALDHKIPAFPLRETHGCAMACVGGSDPLRH
jgi:hypothetical protein